jgi:type II secretion system protein C
MLSKFRKRSTTIAAVVAMTSSILLSQSHSAGLIYLAQAAQGIPLPPPLSTPTQSAQSVQLRPPLSAESDEAYGIRFLGAIVDKNGKSGGVVLLKNLSSNETTATCVGKEVTLHGVVYKVIEVTEEFFVVQPAGSKELISIARLSGTAPPKKVATVATEAPKPTYGGSFKREGFEREGSKIKVSEGYKDHLLKNDLAKILMQACATPVMDGQGGIRGFEFAEIEKDSVFVWAGLQDGDIVKNINGIELDNIGATIQLLNKLKGANDISLIVVRGGEEFTVEVKVQ